jgi:hypothetical protein
MKTMTDAELLDKLIVTAQHETSTHELDNLRASVLERMKPPSITSDDASFAAHLGSLCVIECERAIKQAHEFLSGRAPPVSPNGYGWETCFEHIIKQALSERQKPLAGSIEHNRKLKDAFEEAIFVACIEAQQRGTVDGVEAGTRSTNIERRLRSMAADATMEEHGEAGRVLAAESTADSLLDSLESIVKRGVYMGHNEIDYRDIRNLIKSKMAPWPTPEQVEDYIRVLPWAKDTPDMWKTLVAGNIRTVFSAFSNNWSGPCGTCSCCKSGNKAECPSGTCSCCKPV